ncbi:MAG: hypothetical protein ACYSR0_00435 [Planctomycetota bacterium]
MPDLPSPKMRGWWNKFNGGFKNFDLPSPKELIKAIRMGYSYTAQHENYRKASNFICGQHVALDFDTGDENSSFRHLLSEPFITANASFLHTTHSHVSTRPRSRVVFILQSPLYSVSKYSLLAESFADTFSTADHSCRDPVRIFFGSKDCDVHYLGNTLSLDKAAEVVIPYKEKRKERLQRFNGNTRIAVSVDNPYLETLASGFIHKVTTAPDGQKWYILGKVSRAWGGYIAAGYFDEDEVSSLLYRAITSRNINSPRIARERIEWGLRIGKEDPLYLEEDTDPVLNRLFNESVSLP